MVQLPKDMIVVQEVTDWSTPNHIYFLNRDKSKMFGYIKSGTSEKIYFGGPRGFDPARRKFKVISMPEG